VDRIYLVAGREAIDRRKPTSAPGPPIEAWQDLYADEVFWLGDDRVRQAAYSSPVRATPPGAGLYWLGEADKRRLEGAGAPLPFVLAIPEAAVPVYYGPRLADRDSLPAESSLRARTLSARGIAVVWATLDPAGRRNEYQPASPTDVTFYLRRPGSRVAHLWRLFRTRTEARAWIGEHLAADPDAARWAAALPAEDFSSLAEEFGARG
jgi:hypothetical protein